MDLLGPTSESLKLYANVAQMALIIVWTLLINRDDAEKNVHNFKSVPSSLGDIHTQRGHNFRVNGHEVLEQQKAHKID